MPLDELVSVIETLQQRISDHGTTLRENETRTRMALIDPLLNALGWDVSDPALVTPEYSVGGGRADYALHGSESIPAAIVEAKRLGHSLSDDERMQMLNYANARGIRYAAVTDGNVWEFYEVFKQAPLEDRRLLSLRIANTPAHELALQLLLLWRPNLASGQPVMANEPVLGFDSPEPTPLLPDPTPVPSRLNPAQGWVELSSYQPGEKMPVAIRLPDGTECQVRLWLDLPWHSAAWLWATGKLNRSNLPVRVGGVGKRYIVNVQPVHSDSKPFNSNLKTQPPPIPETPLHFERNFSGKNHAKNAIKLLQHCGIDPAAVQLQIER